MSSHLSIFFLAHYYQDWSPHSLDCYVRPPKNAMSGDKIIPHEVQGILFPEDEDVPRMIKVKCLCGYTRNAKTWQTRNLRPYIPDDGKKGRGHIRMDGALVPDGDITLGMMAELFFRSDLPEGSKINRCIQRITNGRMARPWAGPFVAFRRTHLDTSIDAVMEQDLPVMIRYFTYGKTWNL
jgi:hypothetical protein